MKAINALAIAAVAARTAMLGAQEGTIVGQIVAKATNVPVGYAIVSATPGDRRLFSSGDGRFTIRVPAGRVTLSTRLLGFVPADTTLDVGPRDTVRVTIELSLITIRLPIVESRATACAHPGFANPHVGPELATLFQQVKENADRNRLLSRSYPFELDIERKLTRAEPSLEARFIAFDTVVRSSIRDWQYAPGKLLGRRTFESGAFMGTWFTVTMPELADFADDRFLINHCFDYAGPEVVNGDTLLRVDFVPAPQIREPDVSGSIYLDAKTFQLRSTVLTLVNLNKRMRETMASQSIRAVFREAIPGVAVVDHISSVVIPIEDPKALGTEPATENHRVLGIRFLRGRP
jgi:hypothetical protein